jgi:hypothetical protein
MKSSMNCGRQDAIATEDGCDVNVPDTGIDAKWTEVAKTRLQELLSGEVKPIPGDKVFAKVLERLSK